MKNIFNSLPQILVAFCMEICAMFTPGSTVVLCLPGPMRAIQAFIPFLLRAAGFSAFPQLGFVPTGRTLVATRHNAAFICEALWAEAACLGNVAIAKNHLPFPRSFEALSDLLKNFDVLIMDDILTEQNDIITLSEAAAYTKCTVVLVAYSAEVRNALHEKDPATLPYHLLVGEKVENQLQISASCNPNAKQIVFNLSEDGKEIIDVHY